jgi:hypothetical protein
MGDQTQFAVDTFEVIWSEQRRVELEAGHPKSPDGAGGPI